MTPRRIKQFAIQLGEVAREIEHIHDNFKAQILVYNLLLKLWNPSIEIDDLSEDLTSPSLIQRIRNIIAQIDIHAVKQYYLDKGQDPSIYFYEEFCRACDPVDSKSRGVHYSPPDAVECIINGVDHILRHDFGCTISDSFIFDPCCGTGTFLKHIEDKISPVPSIIGAELSPVACGIASRLLKHSQIQNINSLENIDINTNGKPLVIIGNPPYSGHSTNPGMINNLLLDYRIGLNERNPKWLQDDYVKFIRMAQHRVNTAGHGIVAFITNHSYLFNPTFRSMRQSLMDTFDSIYVINLHGNAKNKKLFNSSKDENIFPIQMGVAISFFVKSEKKTRGKIFYSEIHGSQEKKLKYLSSFRFKDTIWESVLPAEPFILFKPHDSALQREYYGFPSIIDLFKQSSVGFVTSRDDFIIDTDRSRLISRIERLCSLSNNEVQEKYPVGDLDIEKLRKEIRADQNWKDKIIRILYRPFDYRWTYYSPAAMERPRLPFMRNLMNDNIAIAVGRAGQVTGSDTWDVIFCTDCPTDLNIFRRGGATLLPRYIYKDNQRYSNLTDSGYDPDLLFNYIYAVLHSSIYRKRYADFLSIDYPRIPLPMDKIALIKLSELGTKLLHLHLMKENYKASSQPNISIRIGGYLIPQKLIEDKKNKDSKGLASHIATVNYIIKHTIDLQKQIDEFVDINLFQASVNS